MATAFDSEIRDPRDYLKTDYGGFTLHIKPGHEDEVGGISVFLENRHEPHRAQLAINRFLSAMAWKEGSPFVTLGGVIGGARPADKDNPRFNWREGRILRGGIISTFDFEQLQDPPEDRQKLALALYREGLNSNNDFYRFLSFFKILNIGYANGHEQANWINVNHNNVWSHMAQTRLQELQKTVPDVGLYLLRKGRDAIAHTFSQPILDPDLPTDREDVRRNTYLMEGLAQTFIQEELGVPSQRKIWAEHLYELEGFKSIFGDALVKRLKLKENVPLTDFPSIPALTLNLKEQPPYECLNALRFRIHACRNGVVLLATDIKIQPTQVLLQLNFPDEQLELLLPRFGINSRAPGYTKDLAASCYRFLIGYFGNGCLQVFDSATGLRLSYKLAFLPLNVDPHATIESLKKRIEELHT